MRIVVAAVAGVLLALLLSFGVVRLYSVSGKNPVMKPLYNYGTR